MKKMVTIATVLISSLGLAACQADSVRSGQSSNQSNVSKADLGRVAGKNFVGTHRGNGTSKDPTYRYKISFDRTGHFGQEILSTAGYSARFVQQGTYAYDQKNKQVKLNLTRVTETSYQNDADLKTSTDPVRLSIRTSKGQSAQTKLNAAENKTLIVKDKTGYLLGTVNNVKLYNDNAPVKDYNQLANRETAAYSTDGAVVNQKTFYAKLGTSRIWISFNDDGTWNARIIDGTHKWDIYDQGTWMIKAGRLMLTTTGDIYEYTIIGDTQNPNKYSKVTTNSSRVTDNFTWTIVNGELRIASKQDTSMNKIMDRVKKQTTKTTRVAASETTDYSAGETSTTDRFKSPTMFIAWLNDFADATDTYAGNVDHHKETTVINAFKAAYPDKTLLYLGQFRYKSNKRSSNVIAGYVAGDIVYTYEGGRWAPSDTYDALLDEDTADQSDDTDGAMSSSIDSLADFKQWMETNNPVKGEDVESLANVADTDNRKEFKMDVGEVKPLYFFAYSTGATISSFDQWMYADDGQIYKHYTNNNEGGKWTVDDRLTAKLNN